MDQIFKLNKVPLPGAIPICSMKLVVANKMKQSVKITEKMKRL
jgi:hypothetical protein